MTTSFDMLNECFIKGGSRDSLKRPNWAVVRDQKELESAMKSLLSNCLWALTVRYIHSQCQGACGWPLCTETGFYGLNPGAGEYGRHWIRTEWAQNFYSAMLHLPVDLNVLQTLECKLAIASALFPTFQECLAIDRLHTLPPTILRDVRYNSCTNFLHHPNLRCFRFSISWNGLSKTPRPFDNISIHQLTRPCPQSSHTLGVRHRSFWYVVSIFGWRPVNGRWSSCKHLISGRSGRVLMYASWTVLYGLWYRCPIHRSVKRRKS